MGERIRKARDARGWTQRDLAKRIKAKGFIVDKEPFTVSYQSIGYYENDGQAPGADALLAIALTLGVNPAHLLDRRAPETWNPKKEGGLLAADVRRVAHWMLDYAKEDGPIMPMVSEGEAPVVGDPKKKEKSRGTRKPRRGTG